MTEERSSPPAAERPAKPCPICGKPSDAALRPFCSPRCADVDLHRWLSGQYAVPAVEGGDDEGVDSEQEPPLR